MAFVVPIFNEGFAVSTFSEGFGPSLKIGTAKPSLKIETANAIYEFDSILPCVLQKVLLNTIWEYIQLDVICD